MKNKRQKIIIFVSVVICTAYGLLPTDLIADPIPVVGQIDDIGAWLSAFLYLYKQFKDIDNELAEKQNKDENRLT